MTHRHEWTPSRDMPAEPDGAYVYVYEECEWEELVNSYTDDVRGETYYETGAECEATRTTTLVVDRVESDGGLVLEGETAEMSEAAESIWDSVIMEASGRLTGVDGEPLILDYIDRHDGVTAPTVHVEHDGHRYAVEYTIDRRRTKHR